MCLICARTLKRLLQLNKVDARVVQAITNDIISEFKAEIKETTTTFDKAFTNLSVAEQQELINSIEGGIVH